MISNEGEQRRLNSEAKLLVRKELFGKIKQRKGRSPLSAGKTALFGWKLDFLCLTWPLHPLFHVHVPYAIIRILPYAKIHNYTKINYN